MTDEEREIKELERRLRAYWPFTRMSDGDFKLLKKLERAQRRKQPKTPQGQEAPF